MKIAVYCIAKNEEQFIGRWASSCAEADYRVVVDTGSTDGTVAAAQAAGCTVHQIVVSPWRFDDARNASLVLLPSDADFCVALDADEVLVPGWRQALEATPPGVTRPRYHYVWSWSPNGDPAVAYYGDKIHARHGYRWVHPVHEVMHYDGVEQQANINLGIHHHPDNSKSRGQYLPLLEMAVRESPDDDRNAHYLGREYMNHGKTDLAVAEFQRHLGLVTATWPAERARSMRYLAECLPAERLKWIMRAVAEDPYRRENWVALAKYWHDQGRWEDCFSAAQHALSITEQALEYMTEPEAWGYLPYDLAALSAYHLGMLDTACTLGRLALDKAPHDQRLKDNLAFYAGAA